MARGGEAAHVGADLGDDHLGGGPADPADLIQPVDRWGERGDLGLDLGLQLGDVGAGLVDAAKHLGQQEPVMVAEVAGEGLLQLAELGAQAAAGQLRQRLGVPLARDQGGQHRPARDPEDVAGDHRQLDLGVLEQLLHPLLLRGAHPDQVRPVAGQVPQPPDLRGRHEAGPQHLPLGDLAQPHRVQPVGLGPPRQVLDVAGVDQPDLEPVGLQQVERRLPVVAGGLHHHPGHPQLTQPIGQHQQRAGHGRVGSAPPAAACPACPRQAPGHSRPAPPCRYPTPRPAAMMLLGLLGLLQHPASLPTDGQQHGCPQEPQGTGGI